MATDSPNHINPQIAIHDSETGETIVRDMNANELAQCETDKAAAPTYNKETPTE